LPQPVEDTQNHNDEGNGRDLRVKLGASIDEMEQVLIEATLEESGGDKKRTAAILGITTKTLHTKLIQYDAGRGHAHGRSTAAAQSA
jgi:two-component system, NtrC family, response regulator AtoC